MQIPPNVSFVFRGYGQGVVTALSRGDDTRILNASVVDVMDVNRFFTGKGLPFVHGGELKFTQDPIPAGPVVVDEFDRSSPHMRRIIMELAKAYAFPVAVCLDLNSLSELAAGRLYLGLD